MGHRQGRKYKFKRKLYKSQEGLCYLCLKPMSLRKSTLDHVVPRSVGGDHRCNLMLAHMDCNTKRGTTELTQDQKDFFQKVYYIMGMDY